MTHSTSAQRYEAYITIVPEEEFGDVRPRRMTITTYRGTSRSRAITAYKDLNAARVVNCRVVEHGWHVIED